MSHSSLNSMAIRATLHCLFGCAIGEVLGLILGTAFNFSNALTIIIAISFAFFCGYILSIRSLTRAGVAWRLAFRVVLAADTLSILAMEIADNTVEAIIPGAMNAGLGNPLFWYTMPVSLGVAFTVAVPVNRYLLRRGKGHALIHPYHTPHDD